MDQIALKEESLKLQTLRGEGKYQEAIKKGEVLIKEAQKIKDYSILLPAYIVVGASYYSIGDIEKALGALLKHEAICEKYGTIHDELNGTNMLFLLHESSRSLDKAKKALDKGIHLGLRLEKYNMVSSNYSNYSHIYMLEKRYDEALICAKKGLEMAERHMPPMPILKVRVMLNMAKAYSELKNFHNAKKVIDGIEQLGVFEGFPREEGQFYDLKGYWCFKQGYYEEALEWYTKAKNIIASYNDLYLLKNIQEARCQLCEKLGDYQLGYAIQKEYIELLQEISDKEMQQAIVKHEVAYNTKSFKKEARTDELTGVYNRKGLRQKIKSWQKKQDTEETLMACVVLDIDGFKAINDQYGHVVGDQVIQVVVQCCTTALASEDVLGRYGGDEFVIFSKEEEAKEIERKVRQILKEVDAHVFTVGDYPFKVSLSIGIASKVVDFNRGFDSLFEQADAALYEAKRNGKNQICYHEK